jgi:hypothetical protein
MTVVDVRAKIVLGVVGLVVLLLPFFYYYGPEKVTSHHGDWYI